MSAVEVTRQLLERIEALNPVLRAFVAVDSERALARAAALDSERRAGRLRGPLHGVPVAYKDLCYIGGLPNGCGTSRSEYFIAGRDCDVARRLSRAGAITIGKLAMSQLAMGTFGLNDPRGTPVNPWAQDRVPGGSSSGCAVAVASGLVPAAVGTDTGGSIRIPAACCGVVGLKPTYDHVSRAGVMPLSPSLDHVGPLARSVADLALLISVMAQPGRGVGARQRIMSATTGDLHGLRVGVPANDYFQDLAADVVAALAGVARVLADLGATVQPITLPDPQPMMEATATIVRAEAAAGHGHLLLERPEELQPLVRERLHEGQRVLAATYLHAIDQRTRLRAAFVREVFATVDVVLAPMTSEPPPRLVDASGPPKLVAERMAHFAKFARLFNGLGLPVLALPAGFTRGGVPLGVQVAGPLFGESTLLALGMAYDAATAWPRHRPVGSTPAGPAAVRRIDNVISA